MSLMVVFVDWIVKEQINFMLGFSTTSTMDQMLNINVALIEQFLFLDPIFL